MKKILLLGFGVFVTVAFAACSSKSQSNDINSLPAEAAKVVTDNFSAEVANIEIEKNSVGQDEYEVALKDGTRIKFEDAVWDEVSVPQGSDVPEYFVLEPIRAYVSQNHPGTAIVKVDRDKKGYDIELANGVDIEFGPDGTFVAYD